MNDAASTLVIILSAFLAVFLLLACVLVFLLLRVTWQIKKITKSAQHTAESVDTIVSNAAKYSTPTILAKMVSGQIKRAIKRR